MNWSSGNHGAHHLAHSHKYRLLKQKIRFYKIAYGLLDFSLNSENWAVYQGIDYTLVVSCSVVMLAQD